MDREQTQQLFIRVCRDSGFKLDAIDAAHIASRAAQISPLEFWTAVGSLAVMDAIASGKHPAALSQTGA